MQLIDFKILMEEFNIPVVGREATFCEVKLKQYGTRENAIVYFSLNDLPPEIIEKFELNANYINSNIFGTKDRKLLIELIIELSKYYDIHDSFKTNNLNEVLTNINQKVLNKVISYSKTTEKWLNDNGFSLKHLENENEIINQDKIIRNLLIQFDALVNPFISPYYEIKSISNFSDCFSLGYTFTNNVEYYYEGYSCFDINEFGNDNWHTSYADVSNPKLIFGEHDVSDIKFFPSLRYTFFREKDDYHKQYSIKHLYYGSEELVKICGDFLNKCICYDITIGHKSNLTMNKDIDEIVTLEEKEIIIKYLCETLNFLHSKFVGVLCKEKNPFNLTPDERYKITKQLDGKCCDNCTNGCCTIPTREKIGLGEDGLPQGSNCIGWENDYIVGKSKILGRKNIHEL